MKISVIGCGYLGAVHAAGLAKLGHEVIGVDVDEAKISELRAGRAPFFEPQLPELLSEGAQSGRLSFTTDISDVAGCQVHFVCVGTPQRKGDYAADLSYVDAAFEALAPYLGSGEVAVCKSTVPVGTAQRISDRLAETAPRAILAWNPEFLREGHAVKDTLAPDRLVYGLPTGNSGAQAAELLDKVYQQPMAAGTPRLLMDYATSELVKVAANYFLATKISFINAMAEVCDAAGADVSMLADAIGMDERIGRKFLNAGLGFGGGCLPKDIRAFMARAGELGADQALTFLKEVDAINMRLRIKLVELVRSLFAEPGASAAAPLLGKRVTVLGAAFKPDSDDVRDSPALNVAAQLQLQGATVTVSDPEAIPNAAQRFPTLAYEADMDAALEGADIVVLLTEWNQYRELDPVTLAGKVSGKKIVDGRNVLDPTAWRAAGWTYRSLGRP
ncbi:UDP-glucose dehydrogenase family protein [Acaricomes phytoseiuli]|uniref:UDP-glucose dehydrogenase family protein n=1 Tax=Acaricomes phytoseiuli TaxID=291968 RepID=UPI00039DFF11|nr:UDP-glucose/GDP-mannose dehydrogenase family protein [Acaricomes phytoseiuli]